MSDLPTLIRSVETATGPDREIDAWQTCPVCNGSGNIGLGFSHQCTVCYGQGGLPAGKHAAFLRAKAQQEAPDAVS